MKFTAILAAVAAATVVNAQGYNSTSSATTRSHHTHPTGTIMDSRTMNVPKPSAPPTTALTSYYTITSHCGSNTVYLPGTSVYPLSGGQASGGASRSASTYTGTSSGMGARQTMGALAGLGGLAAAAMLI